MDITMIRKTEVRVTDIIGTVSCMGTLPKSSRLAL